MRDISRIVMADSQCPKVFEWVFAFEVVMRVSMVLMVGLSAHAHADQSVQLWEIPVPKKEGQPQAQTIGVPYQINIDLSLLKPGLGAKNQSLVGRLPPNGRTLTLEKKDEEISENGVYVWIGAVAGDPESYATIAASESVVTGDIGTGDGKLYRLRFDAGGLQVIEELDPNKFPPEPKLNRYAPSPNNKSKQVRSLDAFGVCASNKGYITINTLVVVTPAAIGAVGGVSAMRIRIAQAVGEGRLSFLLSKVRIKVRLLSTANGAPYKVPYVESGTMSTDLLYLKYALDGLVGVHTLRDQLEADLVVLITEDPTAAGLSETNIELDPEVAYAVVAQAGMTGNFGFIHEIGHLMGAQHDSCSDAAAGIFAFSHGYIPDVYLGWRTIMSQQGTCCAGCVARPFWSSSTVMTPGGQPMGSETEDNAMTLNMTRCTVSGFR